MRRPHLTKTISTDLTRTGLVHGGTERTVAPTAIRPHMLAAALNQRLQTTLDPTEVLGLFHDAVTQAVPGVGIHFDGPVEGFTFSVGATGAHVANYNLDVDGERMGGMQFGRGQRLANADLASIEELLAALAYPLRNALTHYEALRAAQTDPLTGLFNQLAMTRLLERELALGRRSGQPLALLVVDLDHFKAINDAFGHSIGDRVLQTVAERLQQVTRASDYLFRYGGEEFVILLCDTSHAAAHQAAARVQRTIRDCRIGNGEGGQIRVTASIGIARQCETDSPHSLFKRADLAMYAAKNAGRDRISDAAAD